MASAGQRDTPRYTRTVSPDPTPESASLRASVESLTLVTVVFDAEFGLLELQARSFAAFLDPTPVSAIIVIDNSRRPMSRARRRSLLAAYGPFASRVTFLRSDEVATVPPTIGWRRQQVLKLRIADLVETSTYVVLDAKNHLIRPTGLGVFAAADGRPRGSFHHYDSHPLRATLEAVLGYFDLDPAPRIARFTATSTPFILITRAARQLVAAVEQREGREFAEVFVERRFTEFFLYSAWIESTGASLDELYDDSGIASPTVWPRGRAQDRVASTLESARESGANFFAIHRTALARMDRAATHLIVDFWLERALFPNRAAAARFIRRYRARYLVAMVAKRLGEAGLGR